MKSHENMDFVFFSVKDTIQIVKYWPIGQNLPFGMPMLKMINTTIQYDKKRKKLKILENNKSLFAFD